VYKFPTCSYIYVFSYLMCLNFFTNHNNRQQDWRLVLGLTPSSSMCLDTTATHSQAAVHPDQLFRVPVDPSQSPARTASDFRLSAVCGSVEMDQEVSTHSTRSEGQNKEAVRGEALQPVTSLLMLSKGQECLLQPGR
jgi:hypothetical protein